MWPGPVGIVVLGEKSLIVRALFFLSILILPPIAVPPQAALALGPASVSQLAKDVSGAVVNIGTSRRIGGGRGMPFPDVPEGSPLEDLFDDLNPNEGEGDERMREARSLGSGFVISADGLVVTNYHVIEGADEVLVFTQDGDRYVAAVLGADEKTDLAVLRVEVDEPMPFVPLGDSDSADVGDWVMAIGNPFGLGGSVTLGIVSARNRNINSGPYDNFIQTDAAINQGNSGGPLIDMNGEVVGINTAIISRGGGGLGIGFAVPINLARGVISQLAEFGETRRGWLGVGIQEVSLDMALSLGREDTDGALVVEVTKQGPSDGVLRDGDLILEFNGKHITTMRDLPRAVAETPVGLESRVKVLRGGTEMSFDITLGRLEDSEKVALGPALPVEPEPELNDTAELDLSDLVGMDIDELTDEGRKEFGINSDVAGVLVSKVEGGSDAQDKGIVAGMIIQEVNQKAISGVGEMADLVREAREAGRPAVLFKLADAAGINRFIAVRLK